MLRDTLPGSQYRGRLLMRLSVVPNKVRRQGAGVQSTSLLFNARRGLVASLPMLHCNHFAGRSAHALLCIDLSPRAAPL